MAKDPKEGTRTPPAPPTRERDQPTNLRESYERPTRGNRSAEESLPDPDPIIVNKTRDKE
jgi:hypothetical protein